MNRFFISNRVFSSLLIGFFLLNLLGSCIPVKNDQFSSLDTIQPTTLVKTPSPAYISYPNRPIYSPGEIVDYVAQTGDNLPALAAHFNTSISEILEVNPEIPKDVTFLPTGFPMKIPIYYKPLWGNPFHILPDSHFVNGPYQQGFDAISYINSQPGWLKDAIDYGGGDQFRGGEIINVVAENFSISPRLLIAILEYQTGALSSTTPPDPNISYPLGMVDPNYHGLYLQLVLAANHLNQGYYGWRTGLLDTFDHLDGEQERPDPWQNSASVALQYYFSKIFSGHAYANSIDRGGFIQTYTRLFGDPWLDDQPHIPGNLQQPALTLPFPAGSSWALTGGPHTAWGDGNPLAAVDFAPPLNASGCTPSDDWSTAVADGEIVRVDTGVAVLDLDLDHDEKTGWVIFYLHLRIDGKPGVGISLRTGDPIGHPSCEGGHSTGTHVHIARKYNGEWIAADGALPLNMEGWIAKNGDNPYEGFLLRYGSVVRASSSSDQKSVVTAGTQP